MKEREHILELWRELRAHAQSAVLVTVVKTLGSSYRRPGARLLIASDGRRAGSISGGCLEDDVVKKAWWLSEKGPVVRRYDTTPDGEIGPSGEKSGGFGLGCNGIIYLLIQRVHSTEHDTPLDVMANVFATRQEASLAHVLAPPDRVASFASSQITADWRRAAEESASAIIQLETGEEVFFETMRAPLRLLVFGAGDDAVPLTHFGSNLGWQVQVFDGRAHYARHEKFPLAHLVMVRNSESALKDLQIDTRTAAVVMTHSYSQDLNFLKALADQPLAYLGLLGPRNRSEQLLTDAGIPRDQLPVLHTPAGLDIGADGPEQVALSIVAEIQATLNSRQGGPLRQRVGSIHACASDGLVAAPFVPGAVCA